MQSRTWGHSLRNLQNCTRGTRGGEDARRWSTDGDILERMANRSLAGVPEYCRCMVRYVAVSAPTNSCQPVEPSQWGVHAAPVLICGCILVPGISQAASRHLRLKQSLVMAHRFRDGCWYAANLIREDVGVWICLPCGAGTDLRIVVGCLARRRSWQSQAGSPGRPPRRSPRWLVDGMQRQMAVDSLARSTA